MKLNLFCASGTVYCVIALTCTLFQFGLTSCSKSWRKILGKWWSWLL